MHIYVDESGQFIAKGDGTPKAASIGALIVPSSQRIALHRAYKKLRRSLRPKDTEMKGSTLSESEAAALVRLSRGYDVLLVVVVIDLGSVSEEDVRLYRDGLADKMLENITRSHQPQLVHELWVLTESLRAMSAQLFLQAFAAMQLVKDALQIGTLYYVQRTPQELGSFEWIIDAKDKKPTTAEKTWSTILLPLMQSASRHTPMIMLEGADYSAFDKFSAPIIEDSGKPTGRDGTDLRKVVGERLVFVQSRDQLGLQLCDNLVGLVTRALNGRIGLKAVDDLGRLMPMLRDQAVRIIMPTLDDAASSGFVTDARWADLVSHWNRTAKRILAST